MDKITQNDYQSKYLQEDHPVIIKVEVARALNSDRQAYFLQQVKYWINTNKRKPKNQQYFHDGRWWMYNTLEEWQMQFPWLSIMTIRRIINELKLRGLLLTGNYNTKKYDKTIWYSIDELKLDELIDEHMTVCSKRTKACVQNEQMDLVKMNTPIPETITETSRESTPRPEKAPARSLDLSKEEKPQSEVNQAIGYYLELFEKATGEIAIITTGKDHKLIKTILTTYGIEKTLQLLDAYFETADNFVIERGYSLGLFKANLNGLLVKHREQQAERKRRAAQEEEQREWAERMRQQEALPEAEKQRQREETQEKVKAIKAGLI
jgi:hypothetical protein